MARPNSITITRIIHAAPEEVYRGFTHATMLRDWLSNASSSEPRPGGHLFLRWRDGRTVTGTYQRLDPPTELQATWLDTMLPTPTSVQVVCQSTGEGTALTLKHLIQGNDAGRAEAAARPEAFWNAALENLASVIETGIDLRQARRPRLGIVMDNFTPAVAQKLGVPVDKGVLLAGTAEGSGARAAGLVKDDVLVSLNGVALESPNSFDQALRGLKAGDRPLVEYYRGPEKHSVPLELGSFPIPQLPETAKELAEKLRQADAEVLQAMQAQIAGLSDEQASHPPAEGEWSVKDLVAHFILCERDYQSWVADMLNDTPDEDWLMMRPNVTPRIAALTKRMPSLPALMGELAYAMSETVGMIEAFPEDFVSHRKHLYRRAAQWALEVIPGHYFEEHKNQFQAAIDAARA